MMTDGHFIFFLGVFLIITVLYFYNKRDLNVHINKNSRSLNRALARGADDSECSNYKEIIEKCEDKITGENKSIKIAVVISILYAFFGLCRLAFPAMSNHTIEENELAINCQNNMPCETSDIYYNIWNDLLDGPLQFYIWKEQDDIKDNKQLELNYNHTIAGSSDTAFPIDMPTINKYISVLKNLGYLPKSDKSLKEIDDEISVLKNNENFVPPELYLEELSVRIEKCQEIPSCSNFYQAGRASSDVFTQITTTNRYNYQELLVYSSLAVCFFRMALTFPEEEFNQLKNENIIITKSYVHNQIGTIFLELHEQMFAKKYEGTESYQQHFLFLADAYFEKGINEGNDDLPIDIEAYRTLSEFKKITRYNSDGLRNECLIHANNVLIQFENDENNQHVNESEYIIDFLKRTYYDNPDCISVSANTVSD